MYKRQALLRRAVVLSERYITDRFLPDKAIDLLDEACAAAALRNKAADDYADLKRRREELRQAFPGVTLEIVSDESMHLEHFSIRTQA